MKQISYISQVALVLIASSMVYIIGDSVWEMSTTKFDKDLCWENFLNLPYYFGVAIIMYEGNLEK